MRLYDYVASANCYKARLLLAQLGKPYERVPVDIFGGDTLTDDFAAKNPARSTPVLETDDGRYLQESNAILWYLAEATPFLPEDAFARAQVVRWLVFEQTDVMPGIGGLRFRLLTKRWVANDPEALQRFELGRETLRILEDHLAVRRFLVLGSTSERFRRSAAGSGGPRRRLGSSTTSSRTRRMRTSAPASRSTTDSSPVPTRRSPARRWAPSALDVA